MSLVLLLLAVVVVGVVVAVAAGVLPAGMAGPAGGSPHRPLPPRPLEGGDVDALRFSVVPRGYRMDEVDAALARLRDELDDRERRLAALTAAASVPSLGAPDVHAAQDGRHDDPHDLRSHGLGPYHPPRYGPPSEAHEEH